MEKLRCHYLLEISVFINTVVIFDKLYIWQIRIISFFNERIGFLVLAIQFWVVNINNELLCNGLENCWDYFLDSICEAEQTTLYVLIVIFEKFVEFIEEIDLLLDHSHPTEVKLEKKKES